MPLRERPQSISCPADAIDVGNGGQTNGVSWDLINEATLSLKKKKEKKKRDKYLAAILFHSFLAFGHGRSPFHLQSFVQGDTFLFSVSYKGNAASLLH